MTITDDELRELIKHLAELKECIKTDEKGSPSLFRRIRVTFSPNPSRRHEKKGLILSDKTVKKALEIFQYCDQRGNERAPRGSREFIMFSIAKYYHRTFIDSQYWKNFHCEKGKKGIDSDISALNSLL